MAEKKSVSRTMVTRATLQWDARSVVCRDMGPHPFSAPGQRSAFQAQGPPATVYRARPCWTTEAIGLVPAVSPLAIVWDQEAASMSFDLDPVLFHRPCRRGDPSATGQLVWVHWPEKAEALTPAVHPVLLIHAPDKSLQGERVRIVPSLRARDPLLHHIALVLQAAIEGEGVAGHLYAESLADALVVHFLRRYAAARPSLQEVTGGLSPYKLRRTLAYIQAHLAREVSLATLAAVAQTSPAHFARLFKHATGLAPHQYVITCRMAHAQQLLAETDLPLSEIGLQVGCADQSHFTALFRTHVGLTPKAYRDHTRRA
jgi:AraC-like DNA-binding protein